MLSCGLSMELRCSEGLELLSMFCSVQDSQMVPVSPGDGGLQDQAPGPRPPGNVVSKACWATCAPCTVSQEEIR